MKNVKYALLGLALASTGYAADDGVMWKHEGEIRGRMVNDYNVNGLEQKAVQPKQDTTYWEQRTKFGVQASKGEEFTGYLNFLHAATWGRDLGTATVGTASGDSASAIGRNNPDNVLVMNEAWLGWRPTNESNWKLGRWSYHMADGLVMGRNDYAQTPQTYEGLIGSYDFGFMDLGFMGVKAAEFGYGDNTPAADVTVYNEALAYDKEHNFYGLMFDIKNLPDFLKRAHLHIIRENVDVSNTKTTLGKTSTRWGISLGGDYMNFDYNLGYASVGGKKRHQSLSKDPDKDVKIDANMMDFKAGYTFPDMYKFRIGLIYHKDSGDKDACKDYAATDCDNTDSTYDGFYYDKAGNSDGTKKLGWGNLTYYALQLSAEPMENTTAGFNYWSYSRTQDTDGAYAYGGGSWYTAGATAAFAGTGHNTTYTPGNANRNDKKALGTAWDLFAKHAYSDSFSIEARYTTFNMGDFFKKNATANADDLKRDAVSQFFLSAKLKL